MMVGLFGFQHIVFADFTLQARAVICTVSIHSQIFRFKNTMCLCRSICKLS